MESPQLVSVIKDCIIAAASCIGAGVAILGLDAWKKQLKGTTSYQVAQKLLRTALYLRDAISDARQRIIWGGEMVGRDVAKDETIAETQVKGEAYAYTKRLSAVRTAHSDFYSAGVEARTVWGEDTVSDALQSLTKLTNELVMAASDYFDMRLEEAKKQANDRVEIRRLRGIIFSIYPSRNEQGKTDDYSGRLVTVLQAIETLCRKHLK